MAFKQLITPNLRARADAGNCLVMAQNITGAPAQNPSATEAANRTKFRHGSRQMPNTVAVLWFDHWGTYGRPAQYKNWGHVVVYVPGKGFASSSPNPWEYDGEDTGGGIYWYDSIEAVERTFNASFRFWSEDINGRRVCEPAAAPKPPAPAPIEGSTDVVYWRLNSAGAVYPVDLVRRKRGKWLSKKEWDAVQKAWSNAGFPSAPVANVEKAVLDGIPFA